MKHVDSSRARKYMKLEEPTDGVAVVSFARSDRLNAVNEEMLDEMLEVLDEVAAGYPKRYRAVVLRGEGDGFSAGGDLEAFRDVLHRPPHSINSFIARFHQWALSWYALPMPTIAAMHGAVAGGGAAMGTICDLRYAAQDTVLRFSFAQIGLVPDMGSSYILPTLVGFGRAFDLLLTGEPVTAEEGCRIGLFSKILPTREELDIAVVATATAIAKAPPEGVRQTKQLLRGARNSSFADSVAHEVGYQTERFLDPVFAARIESFFSKRPR